MAQDLEAALTRIATLLEKQQGDQAVKDTIQMYSGLSVVAAFIASISLSFLSYTVALAQINALNNSALLALYFIFHITTGGSLFIAGCTGLVAVTAGAGHRHSRRRAKYRRLGGVVLVVGLFLMLFTMLGGLIVLANAQTVDNTPVGNVHLRAAILYPLLGCAVAVMVMLSFCMVWSGRGS
ncbi:hypothetical protein C8R43DRAFT_1125342 [Mycena crocata]|nr:hypothetical protein C8R43DRAFT_1125342 [Mycena crocata]